MRLTDLIPLVSRRGEPILDYVDDWSAGLLQLSKLTAAENAENPYLWGPDDYIGVLFRRNIVQAALESSNHDPRSDDGTAIPQIIAALDRYFIALSAPDSAGMLQRMQPNLPTSPWWWGRIPIRGPILREIEDIYGRIARG